MEFVNCYDVKDIFNIYLENLEESEREGYEFTYASGFVIQFLQVLFYRRRNAEEKWEICRDLEIPILVGDTFWSRFEVIDGEVCESILLTKERRFVITKGYEEIITKFQEMLENRTGPIDEKRFEEFVRVLKALRLQQIF
ncbi:hypothetical protein [Bacillus thuringiensis]